MRLLKKSLIGAFAAWTAVSPVAFAEDPKGPANVSNEEVRSAFDPVMLPAQPAVEQPRITLELKGVDILDVLKILSQRSEMNIVAGKNVRGLVTLYLKNVGIRDALDTIISTLELAYAEENGIIKVMTAKEFEDLYGRSFGKEYTTRAIQVRYALPAAVNLLVEKLKSPKGKTVFDERTHMLIVTDRLENIEAIEKAVKEFDRELETKVFQLEYARVDEIEAQVHDYLTPQSGVAKIDKRTNQLTVTDRQERVEQIGEVIEALDIRPRQVLIQAQVVEVDLFDAFRYGIDWEYIRTRMGQFSNIQLTPAFDVAVPTAALGAGTLSTFTLGGFHGLTTVLSLLQNVGKTNTLSSPRITVINNEEAKLVDATRQPYVSQTVVQGETTSQTADNIQFVDVGVTLTVVPTIADNERVVLKLKPEVSSQTGTLNVQSVSQSSDTLFTRSQIPIVSSQTLETTVVVKSGETLVVGGLIKDNDSKMRRKLPILSDIPFLGAAFRSEEVNFRKAELVIFLTPYIVSGDTTSEEHAKYFNTDEQMIDFDVVGGYDFGKALKHSQGPLRVDHEPFWKIQAPNFPDYFLPAELYQRTLPYENSINRYESFQDGKALPVLQAVRELYQNQAAQEVQARLNPVAGALKLEGTSDLAVRIAKDGTLKDLSWIEPGPFKDTTQQRLALQTVRGGGAFAAFPDEMASEEELLDLRLRFSPKLPEAAPSKK